MKLLLDTHVLLWWMIDDPKLPAHCAAWIEDRGNDIVVSPLSAYELRFKATKGLLPGGDALAADIGALADRAGFAILALSLDHALIAGALPMPHRDPFDRLLAAQAIVEGYMSLSSDEALDSLGVERAW